MCGITGYLNYKEPYPNPEIIKRMTDILRHRGPDGEGFHISGPIALGHRRLSIIDLSPAGKQPMCNEDGTIWITYNGEIYNFEDIRSILETKGHQFRSKTDSEVVVHAYEEWGLECLSRFNGMFAFGIWDQRREFLWLVRDRLGVKPLFYSQLPGGIVFGSEIKAVLCSPGISREIDYESLAYYLALNYTPAPNTLFQGVRQLLPGHYLTYDKKNGLQTIEYWDVRYEENGPRFSAAEYEEQLSSLLEDSIRLRLKSDVPFGAFLSGGIDSSSVVYWMSQHMNEPVKTFTIGFPDATYDERHYAHQVAEMLNTNHFERVVDADMAAILPKIVYHAEEPTADSSMIPMYYVAKLAREKVTMALSGDGMDEILAGYETYQAYYAQRLYRLIPAWLRHKLIQPLVKQLPVSDTKVSWDFKLRRFVNSGELEPEDAHALWRMIFDAESRHRLMAPLVDQHGVKADVLDLYRDNFRRSNARHPLNRMLYVDTRFYLPNDMLVKVDRMTMANSLEAREPMLDYRLVEFAATVPPNLKLKNLRQHKYLLKRVMSNRLPSSVIKRKKVGFNVPNSTWIKKGLKPFVMDHLSPSRMKTMGLFDSQTVDQLLRDHFDSQADNSHQIWSLITLSLWWEQFIEEWRSV